MFKAGFSRVDVTPPLGTYIPGYFDPRYAKGVLDPLYLNALAYTDGKKTNIVIACDALSISREYAQQIREMICAETGVGEDAIFIHALHSHTAFTLRADRSPEEYAIKVILRKFCDVSKMAIDDMDDAEAYTAARETPEPISFVRRYLMKDGRVVTNPPYQDPGIVRRISEADNTVRLVRFKRAKSPDIALVNFQTHPDVISGEKFSADWPGFTRRFVEKDIGDVHCILINGPQGDTNHVDFTKPGLMNGVPGHSDYRYSRKMVRIIADTVCDIWNTGEKRPEGALFSEIRFAKTPSNREGEDKYDEAAAIMKDYEENKKEYSIEQLGAARRILILPQTPKILEIPVSVQGFSNIVFVGFGGEAFTEYANEIRRSYPGSFILSTCITNGSMGYFGTKAAFSEGGYEARSSRFTSSLPDDVLGTAKDMLNNHNVK